MSAFDGILIAPVVSPHRSLWKDTRGVRCHYLAADTSLSILQTTF
jgi:hypothetical protein